MTRLQTTLLLFLFAIKLSAQACFVGTQISGTIEKEHLTKLTLSASIQEYEWEEIPNSGCVWYSENHTIHFQGIEGTTSFSFGIRNYVSDFTPGSFDRQVFVTSTRDGDEKGIGFYFFNPHRYIHPIGIEPIASSDDFLRFAHVLEPTLENDFFGHNYNIFSRDALPSPSTDPIRVKWIIEKKAVVEDPDIQSFDINNLEIPLLGTYAVWNIQMQIQDELLDIANYYILEDLASSLNAEVPLTLGQLYLSFPATTNTVSSFKSKIEYTEIIVEDVENEYCITDWQITDNIPCALEESLEIEKTKDPTFGWIEEANRLNSIAGFQDEIVGKQEIDYAFQSIICQNPDNRTSTKEIKKLNITIYPNPTEDFLYFKLTDKRKYSISLFDQSGQKLASKMSVEEIDIRHLPTGVYLIEIIEIGTAQKGIYKILKN